LWRWREYLRRDIRVSFAGAVSHEWAGGADRTTKESHESIGTCTYFSNLESRKTGARMTAHFYNLLPNDTHCPHQRLKTSRLC